MVGDANHPVTGIISAFGGIRPMAAKLEVPVSTVQGWKQRNSIPAARMKAIRAVAEDAGIDLPEPGSPPPAPASPPRSPNADEPPVRELPAPAARAWAPGLREAAIAILAVAATLGVAGWVWWSSAGPGAAAGDARIAALEAQIARLADALGDRGRPPPLPAANPGADARPRADANALSPADVAAAVAPLRDRLALLAARLDELARRAEAPGAGLSPARLEALEAEVRNAAEIASASRQAMSDDLPEFGAKLRDLEIRLAALDAGQADQAQLAALAGRLDALEQAETRRRDDAAEATTLALAAGQLREALARGAPYRAALDLVASLAAGDPELAGLVAGLGGHADAGVPTPRALRASFAALAPEALVRDSAAAEGDVLDRLAARARTIVRVRRIGADAPGDSVEATVARAEAALADDDVAAALGMLAALEGSAAGTFAPWIAQARARLAAHDAAAALAARSLARLQSRGRAQ